MKQVFMFDTYEEMDEYFLKYELPELPKGAKWMKNVHDEIWFTIIYIYVNLNGYWWCIDRQAMPCTTRASLNKKHPEYNTQPGWMKLWPGDTHSFAYIRELERFGLRYQLRIDLIAEDYIDLTTTGKKDLQDELDDLDPIVYTVQKGKILTEEELKEKQNQEKAEKKAQSKSTKKEESEKDSKKKESAKKSFTGKKKATAKAKSAKN